MDHVVYRGWQYRVSRLIPTAVLEQPWAIFIKGLCIISGLTTFAGPKPGTVESSLPGPVVYVWAATLVLGALFGLVGLLHPRWQQLEVAGLIWLGTAALVYAATIGVRFRADGMVAASIVAAFGMAAFVRALAVYVTYELARDRVRQ
jgi:hypothetical protein